MRRSPARFCHPTSSSCSRTRSVRAMGRRKVPAHVVRFYHPDNIATVHHMTYNPETDQLAVLKRLRHDGTSSGYSVLEVWAVGPSRNTPVVLKRIFVNSERHSLLENLAWGNEGRLFSCSHNSCLIEHDVSSNAVKKSLTVGGGVVWCIATDSSRNNIASGSEDGTITVFALGDSSESISFGKVVGKCATRVLSIVWTADHSSNSRIVAGSIDFITIWSLKSSTCLDKLDVKQGYVPHGETIVWSLAVCGNYLISGDSKGFTSFWNLKQRVNVKSIQSHEADILSVAAASDGRVYSSGVDPKLSCFQIHDDGVDILHKLTVHRNDVKSIVIGPGDNVLSAGNGSFFVQNNKGSKRTTLSFLDLKPNIHMSGSSVMFNYHKSLELYSLSLDAEPVKSLVVNSKHCILSSTFNHSFVVYRTMDKLFILKRSPDQMSVQKIEHHFSESPISIDYLLLVEETLLIVCHDNVFLVKLPDGVISNPITLSGAVFHLFSIGERVVFILMGRKMTALDLNSLQLTEMQPVEDHVVDHTVSPSDNNSFWLLMANKKILSYDLSAPLISSSTSIGVHYRHSIFQGMAMCRTSLLLYSNDFILTLGRTGYTLRSTSGSYKHIARLGVDGKVVIVVELSDEELNQILPPKLDGKSTQSFIK